ncbi:MAG: aspartate carbamoyltransferase catalytic subunit [bacterium]
MELKSRHLLGLENMPQSDIKLLLDTAFSFKKVLKRSIPKVPTLRGKTVVNLFFEPSTRTRFSFELAEKRLSADTVNFSASSSSVLKGETLKDTIRNIESMKIDMIVMRHSSPGAALYLSHCVKAAVINAGDGGHEHPTQALLDMMTIQEKLGRIQDLNVVIIGDVKHSRVCRSNIFGLKTMGAKVGVCGPGPLLPRDIEQLGVTIYPTVEDAIAEADILNILRIQLERQKGGLFPSLREYRNLYGITRERISQANKKLCIMHPGPMNRGVEIDSEVADGDHSVILKQVTNGVAVRMAALYLLSGKEANKIIKESS